jgi:hypothetical protein
VIIRGRNVSPWRLALVGAAVAGLAACGASGSSGSSAVPTSAASAAKSLAPKVTASAPTATQWLTANGYASSSHLPEFGHVVFGIKPVDQAHPDAPRYAAVWVTTGKNPALVNVIVTDVQTKLKVKGVTDVTITYDQANNRVIVQAPNEKAVKAAGHALVSAILHPGNGGNS